MPPPQTPTQAFHRKGKLFFIQHLEKHRDLSALLADIEFVFKNPQTREVVLYFQQKFRPFPNIVAPLSCAIDHLRRSGRNVRVNASSGELEETSYLEPRVLDAASSSATESVGRVWKYSTSEDVYSILSSTLDYLSYRLVWEQGTLHALEWSLYELLDNVFQHSRAPSGYFMFQVQQESRRLSYCVADQGLGIYRSFSGSVHKPTSAVDAITLAVQKGVTRDSESNMGNGLWGATEIVARSRGQMTITSGGAALYFNRATGKAESVPKVFVVDRDNPGTYIDCQIDASVAVRMEEMFDPLSMPVNLRIEAMEDETGAVRMNVRDLRFGAGTRENGGLARAYALNLLSQSSTPLVIDFTGVGIVSSSFADEFVAKLCKHLGPDHFNSRVRLSGLSDTLRLVIQSAVSRRLGGA
jgi:hypothetical protein